MTANVAAAALSWLSHDDRPRLLIDSALNLLWHNEQALRILSLISAMRINRGELTFHSTVEADRFRSEIVRLETEPRTWALKDGGSGRFLLVVARKVVVEPDWLVAVEFFSDGDLAPNRYVPYHDEYGLTIAERAVLQGFTDGLSPQQIAVHRGVGIETVRAQIRTLYQKLGVCSREQMFRKIAPFRR